MGRFTGGGGGGGARCSLGTQPSASGFQGVGRLLLLLLLLLDI